MRSFTWNRFPIKNLLIDSLLTPIVESTYLNIPRAVVLKPFWRRKPRVMTLSRSPTKEILTQVNWHILFYSRMKSVTQNVRGFVETLLRAAQKYPGCLESHAALSRTMVENHLLRASDCERFLVVSDLSHLQQFLGSPFSRSRSRA